METKVTRSCADCAVINCNNEDKSYPEFCLTTKMNEAIKTSALHEYENEFNRKVMSTAANVEFDGYGQWPRVYEIVEFAKRMDFHKIGIATCVGLINETRTITKIFRSHGFEVFGIGCKAGAVPKVTLGIDEKCNAVGKNICNPILQAKLLNEEKTDLNVVVGLCVGHDSMFYKYSDAIVTTLITKDRVTGHNPAAAIYNADTYYAKKLYGNQ